MNLIKQNIWDFLGVADAICITTNGFVKSNNRAVMGRGIALDTKNKFKDIDLILGKKIKKSGNIVNYIIKEHGTTIVSFPVKRDMLLFDSIDVNNKIVKHMKNKFRIGQVVPGWALKAELSIIEESAKQLSLTIDNNNWKKVYMTQPGCHNGELDWNDVEPILDKYLDDRVTCVYI